jgi:replicative DNA helicase
VQDYSVKRQLYRIASEAGAAAVNGKRSTDIMADMQTKLARLTILGGVDDHTSEIGDAVTEAYDWTDRASRGEIKGVVTELTDLDKLLGCLIAGNTYIIAGRPGTGKTAFMVTVAYQAAKAGKRIAFFSLEMSRLQIAQRFMAIESGIDLHRIITGALHAEEWPMLTHASGEISALPITINDWSGISISGIRRTARRIQAAHPIDLMIVDYLQLADGEGKGKDTYREQEVSAISRGIKHLANELHVPVLAGAQLNRASESRADRRPQLSDLRESGSLEQDAYGVMFLHRTDDPERANVTECIVAKHRNGPTGSVDLLWKAPVARFDNCAARTVSFSDTTPHWAGDD